MRPDQLPLLLVPGTPSVHPDGRHGVVALTRASFEADDYVGQLWRLDLVGAEPPRRLTRGHRDTAPQFSPDGRLLAFLRATPDARPQLFVAPASGGEAVRATDAKLGVGEFCWSPDSTKLAFVARVPDDGRYGTLDGVGAHAEDPRHLTGYQVQENGLGWTGDRRRQLFVVDAPDPAAEPPVTPVGRAARAAEGAAAPEPRLVPEARQLTQGDFDVSEPTFTAAGDAVLVTSARDEDADTHLRSAIHRVDVASGETTPVLNDPRLSFSGARPSGDGRWLFALGVDLGEDGRDFVAKNAAVYVADADRILRRDDPEDDDADDHAVGGVRRLTDPEDVEPDGPLAASGDDAVLVSRNVRGTNVLLRVDAGGGVVTLSPGSTSVRSYAAVPGGSDVLAIVADAGTPGEAALLSPGRQRRLTHWAASLREATTIVVPRELTATSPDGHPVHGWALVPEGEGPHPVLLCIHGGPYSSYGPAFFDEFQVYAEAGYAVVACNPRGSAGYGQAHGAAIRHDFGNLDAADVLAFLDHATATVEGLDAARVGIMGGSYGGYLTAWIIAHDHRWAGAIVERGFLDPASFLGSSDIGWFFMSAYNGPDLAEQNRQSPTLLAHEVRTPTLVLHSELDLRCPLAQALRYYTALKQAGVPAELLVFPGENHELSRSGTPWHRRQRFDAVLDWWRRWLPVSGEGGGPGQG